MSFPTVLPLVIMVPLIQSYILSQSGTRRKICALGQEQLRDKVSKRQEEQVRQRESNWGDRWSIAAVGGGQPFILKQNIWRVVTALWAENCFNILSLQLGQASKVGIFSPPSSSPWQPQMPPMMGVGGVWDIELYIESKFSSVLSL